MVPGGSTPGSGQPWGPGAEATSGKHLTSYCVQITIHVISSFRQQIEEGKRHFHSALCGGKVSQKLWVERPKLHTYYSFQAEECFAYFLWGREYSDFSGDVDAASSSSCWLRGRDQRERRFVGGKKSEQRLWFWTTQGLGEACKGTMSTWYRWPRKRGLSAVS